MIVMRGPRSYTTEDVVEFHLPGSQALAELVLDRCLAAGARHALPGEFTRRAYEGGRIDAAQVEGVLRMIESRSDEERIAAIHLLRGGAARDAAGVRRELVQVLADIEAYLDFTDEDTEAVQIDPLRARLERCLAVLETVQERIGRRIPFRNLPRMVILGPPNSGKSTLFKALVPGARALSSDRPGTTRDLLEGEFRLEGAACLLYDAPGVCQSRDPLERLAVTRLHGMMARMDAAMIVLDGARAPEREQLREIASMTGRRPRLYVLNKCDLSTHPGWRQMRFDEPPLRVSALKGSGMAQLAARLAACWPPPAGEGGGGVDFRTRSHLQRTRSAIRKALKADWHGGLEIVAMELRAACDTIGRISGRVMDEDILNTVFSRFCVGK
jgi:tRNA modification GTPase